MNHYEQRQEERRQRYEQSADKARQESDRLCDESRQMSDAIPLGQPILVDHYSANRVMFLFDGKPADEVRAVLKRHAFKWSPSRGAWVRQLTNSGIYAGECVRQALDAE